MPNIGAIIPMQSNLKIRKVPKSTFKKFCKIYSVESSLTKSGIILSQFWWAVHIYL